MKDSKQEIKDSKYLIFKFSVYYKNFILTINIISSFT